MVEFIADRDLVSGATTNWDVVPEIQIPISKRMHILGSVGFRIPVNNTGEPAEAGACSTCCGTGWTAV